MWQDWYKILIQPILRKLMGHLANFYEILQSILVCVQVILAPSNKMENSVFCSLLLSTKCYKKVVSNKTYEVRTVYFVSFFLKLDYPTNCPLRAWLKSWGKVKGFYVGFILLCDVVLFALIVKKHIRCVHNWEKSLPDEVYNKKSFICCRCWMLFFSSMWLPCDFLCKKNFCSNNCT